MSINKNWMIEDNFKSFRSPYNRRVLHTLITEILLSCLTKCDGGKCFRGKPGAAFQWYVRNHPEIQELIKNDFNTDHVNAWSDFDRSSISAINKDSINMGNGVFLREEL